MSGSRFVLHCNESGDIMKISRDTKKCIYIIPSVFDFCKFSGGKIELFLADAKNKKEGQPLFKRGALLFMLLDLNQYIPPPMPPAIAALAAASAAGSFLSATTLSVVSTTEAMEAAF